MVYYLQEAFYLIYASCNILGGKLSSSHNNTKEEATMDVTGKIDTKDPNATNKEVKSIYSNLFGIDMFDKVEHTLSDMIKLFDGKYPGYLKSDTRYHDLEHSLQAYLATARILDGIIRSGNSKISKEFVVLGLIAAIGHDTGFIKETQDMGGTGAKHTLIHVDRSIEFMGRYLAKIHFGTSQITQVKNIICCTGFPHPDLPKIYFSSEEERKTGYIMGTADYLGQMSDSSYVKKLPLLYEEFKEGGVPHYTSAQDLVAKTPTFYRDQVMNTLTKDYHSVYKFAANHFGGNNLYIEGIERNIKTLEDSLILECPRS